VNISEILKILKLSDRCSSGELVVRQEKVAEGKDAIAKLRAFGGSGWLCSTDSRNIQDYRGSFPEVAADAWPIAGEACKGDESLHLTRSPDGWLLTSITKGQGNGVLLTVAHNAVKGGSLEYEVHWKPENIEGLTELRPAAYRFIGFGK
jgi:hypothetical protein